MDTVHVRFLRYSAFYTPLLLTLAGDALERVGIAATFDRAEGGRTVDAGFADGTVQVAQSAPAVSFRPSVAGAPPVYRHFALMNRNDGFFLAARDASTPFSWRDLEGRSVLVDHFFQPLALFQTALRLKGVDARQVRVIDAGSAAEIERAFREGRGDFVHMQGPAPQQLEAEGLGRVVASIGEATGHVAFSSLCARPEWLETSVARRFVQVYRACRSQASQAAPAWLAAQVASFLPETSRPALEATIAAYQALGTWSGSDALDAALFERTVDLFVDVGDLTARPQLDDVFAPLPPSA